jgi:hypothetical protein
MRSAERSRVFAAAHVTCPRHESSVVNEKHREERHIRGVAGRCGMADTRGYGGDSSRVGR